MLSEFFSLLYAISCECWIGGDSSGRWDSGRILSCIQINYPVWPELWDISKGGSAMLNWVKRTPCRVTYITSRLMLKMIMTLNFWGRNAKAVKWNALPRQQGVVHESCGFIDSWLWERLFVCNKQGFYRRRAVFLSLPFTACSQTYVFVTACQSLRTTTKPISLLFKASHLRIASPNQLPDRKHGLLRW